jgi:protein-tyrosine-phosphatase
MREFLRKLKEKQDHQMFVKIVFVCTANCCRSPLAEILFEHILIKKLGSIDQLKEKRLMIESAGTMYSGLRISPESEKILIREEGIG